MLLCSIVSLYFAITVHGKGVLEYDDSARDRLQLMFLVYALCTICCIHVMHINGRWFLEISMLLIAMIARVVLHN